MINKLSDKDKKDWEKFVKGNQKVENKDKTYLNDNNKFFEKTIDLHGYTLENANIVISDFIIKCFLEGTTSIQVITGKGSRSKNKEDPYLSKDLGILKYSVPDYIKNNSELMDKILSIDFESINSPSKGSFDIILKKK